MPRTVEDLRDAQLPELLGDSRAMHLLRGELIRYAGAPFPVLIEGESGVGKERVALHLHARSSRRGAAFRAINCAALSPEMLESQLFGTARGAYTGADRERPGLLEETTNGTLLLDEVGEMPAPVQAKLLRVLEDGEFYRLGETRPRRTEARVLAATNVDLRAAVQAGRFRADLYHRLGVLELSVPPLRQRDDDWALLLRHFCTLHREAFAPFTLSAAAAARLGRHDFPGNVRELRNLVVRLGLAQAGGEAGLGAVETVLTATRCPRGGTVTAESLGHLLKPGFRLEAQVAAYELQLIRAALERSCGNLSQAARLLGANRTTLYGKLARHGMALPTAVGH